MASRSATSSRSSDPSDDGFGLTTTTTAMSSQSIWSSLPLLLLVTACAGGGGGGGGGGGPINPPTGPTAFTQQAGLDSVIPGPRTLRIDFTPPPTSGFDVAAFISTDRTTIFAGAPHVPAA